MLTSEQKKLRKTGLGGSDIGAICGVNPYRTPLDVYMDKLGLSEEEPENEAMRMGNLLEPVVAQLYQERTGNELKEEPTLFHKRIPYLLANVDRMIFPDHAVLEIKTTSAFNKKNWGEEGTDDMPLSYLLQCAHYAMIVDASYVDLALLIGGHEFRVYTYRRHEELEKKILKKASIFWEEHIMKKIPPPAMNGKDTTKWWHGKNRGASITKIADNEVEKKIERLKKTRDMLTLKTKEYDALKEEIQLLIGNHEILADKKRNPLIIYKPSERTTVDTKKLKEIDGSLYEQLKKTTLYRKLEIV